MCLKINCSVKTPLHRPSIGVDRPGLWAPGISEFPVRKFSDNKAPGGGGFLGILGRGVPLGSSNPDPISDQNGQNLYPFSEQNGAKTIPDGAAYLYSLYKGIPPPPLLREQGSVIHNVEIKIEK